MSLLGKLFGRKQPGKCESCSHPMQKLETGRGFIGVTTEEAKAGRAVRRNVGNAAGYTATIVIRSERRTPVFAAKGEIKSDIEMESFIGGL